MKPIVPQHGPQKMSAQVCLMKAVPHRAQTGPKYLLHLLLSFAFLFSGFRWDALGALPHPGWAQGGLRVLRPYSWPRLRPDSEPYDPIPSLTCDPILRNNCKKLARRNQITTISDLCSEKIPPPLVQSHTIQEV